MFKLEIYLYKVEESLMANPIASIDLWSCSIHRSFQPVDSKNNEVVQNRIGDHDLDTVGDTPIEKTVNIQDLIPHPKRDCVNYDLIILVLSENLDLNVYTPACLAQPTDIGRFDYKDVTVAGWGALWSAGPQPRKPFAPREVQLRVLPDSICGQLKLITFNKTLDKSEICTQFDGKDACQVYPTLKSLVNLVRLAQ